MTAIHSSGLSCDDQLMHITSVINNISFRKVTNKNLIFERAKNAKCVTLEGSRSSNEWTISSLLVIVGNRWREMRMLQRPPSQMKYKGNRTERGLLCIACNPRGNVFGLISRFSIDGSHHRRSGPLRSWCVMQPPNTLYSFLEFEWLNLTKG